MALRQPLYDWIVFDASGTLMQPTPSPGEVYHRFARELGSTLSLSTVRDRFPGAFSKAFGTFEAPVEGLTTNAQLERERWREIVRLCIDDLDPVRFDRLFEQLWDYFANPVSWQLFDGVSETIDRILAQGVPVAVASNFDERLKPVLARHLPQIPEHHIFTSAEIGYAKPDPHFYRTIAQKLLAANPSRLLMVGDDSVNDVLASQAAGWHAEQIRWRQGAGIHALSRLTEFLEAASS